jgi:hypothetical protein
MLKKLLFGCFAFAVLSFSILHRPAWTLNDFDQGFYLTIAYDLDKHGVFSNGPFAGVDSTVARPPPGMFFGPVYPALVLAAMKLDGRFAASVRCSVSKPIAGIETQRVARPTRAPCVCSTRSCWSSD